MSWTAKRHHDISCGHRVHQHEGKCKYLHGHNYRIHFTCEANTLDTIGRVIDFGDMKGRLCFWLEDNWDHKMLLWEKDPLSLMLRALDNSVVIVPFNPTAENIAKHLVEVVGPVQLMGLGIRLTHVEVEETRKCSAGYHAELFNPNIR